MRLRVCDKAEDHTQQAAHPGAELAQSELARRQAATLRTMMREGIERDWLQRVRLVWPVACFGRLWTRNRRKPDGSWRRSS